MDITQEIFEFQGPAYLTLVSTGCMVGKGRVEIQDTNGDWHPFYQGGEMLVVGTSPETIAITAPGTYRVVYTCRDCDGSGDTTEWDVIAADFGTGSGELGCCEPVQTEHVLSAGTTVDVPAGLHSVTINSLTGAVSLSIGGGSFLLGDGSTIVAISLTGQEHGVNGLLPAIVITGGTWQWLGQDKL